MGGDRTRRRVFKDERRGRCHTSKDLKLRSEAQEKRNEGNDLVLSKENLYEQGREAFLMANKFEVESKAQLEELKRQHAMFCNHQQLLNDLA